MGYGERVVEGQWGVGGEVEKVGGESVEKGEARGCEGRNEEVKEKCDEKAEEGGADEEREKEIVEESEEGELVKVGEEQGEDGEVDGEIDTQALAQE